MEKTDLALIEAGRLKDNLIVKQQLEIEELKKDIADYKIACSDAYMLLWRPEQWSTKCPDFPGMAMSAIVKARAVLEDFT